MKVCLLAPVPPPAGGIAGWTKRMMSAKLKNNWHVEVVDEQVIGGRTNFGKTAQRHFIIEIKRCFKIWINLNNKLFFDKDIKIVQSCVPAGMGSLAREMVCKWITHFYRRKYVIHFRCTVPNMVKSKVHIYLFKAFVKSAESVFVLNEQSLFFSRVLCPKQNYKVIPNFIDNKELYLRPTVNEKIQRILYVGGVIPEKGCEKILSIARKFPNIEFRLVGKVGINTEAIPDNVILCGEQKKDYVNEELETADVFMFLSKFWGEGFSNALAEAMGKSLPCIVSDWAANADMIQDKGGIVVDVENEDEIVDAIKKIEDPHIRKKMGVWNYERVKNEYSQKVITDQYVDAYEELLK